jgi:hypothetical protein
MPPQHRVADIASQAQLSRATVDRVLHGRVGASPRAVRAVEQALLDLDRQDHQLRLGARTLVVDVVMQAPERFQAAYGTRWSRSWRRPDRRPFGRASTSRARGPGRGGPPPGPHRHRRPDESRSAAQGAGPSRRGRRRPASAGPRNPRRHPGHRRPRQWTSRLRRPGQRLGRRDRGIPDGRLARHQTGRRPRHAEPIGLRRRDRATASVRGNAEDPGSRALGRRHHRVGGPRFDAAGSDRADVGRPSRSRRRILNRRREPGARAGVRERRAGPGACTWVTTSMRTTSSCCSRAR